MIADLLRQGVSLRGSLETHALDELQRGLRIARCSIAAASDLLAADTRKSDIAHRSASVAKEEIVFCHFYDDLDLDDDLREALGALGIGSEGADETGSVVEGGRLNLDMRGQ